MMTLEQFLESKGCPAEFPLDGTIYRFDLHGKKDGWFVGREIPTKSGLTAKFALVASFKTGEEHRYEEEGAHLTDEERIEARAKFEEIKKQQELEQAKEQSEIAARAELAFDEAKPASASDVPYLVRKRINDLFGCRAVRNSIGKLDLIVPCRDVNGKLWGMQRIAEDGFKSFMPGQKKKGTFYAIGKWLPTGKIYIAEGFATGASIHMATGQPVIIAFDCYNLESVAKEIRAAYPKLRIVFCADDDHATEGNPGISHAQAAARLVGATVVSPKFDTLEGKATTDFNDLHIREGLEAVRLQLESGTDIEPLPVRVSRTGKPVLPSQQTIVEHLLEHFSGKLIKQERDVFAYTGTHWRMLSLTDHDRLKQMIQRICGGLADMKLIEPAYKLFIIHLPSVPENVDLYVPNPSKVNFTNGTLHLVRGPDRKYQLHFKEHRPEDYVVNMLPYEYKAGDTTRNAEFDAMLERVFEGDVDKDQKIRAVRQMYGACLVPLYPHLFMCYGPAGTGKSTIINIAARLVAKDNLCSVAPSEFVGFNMESMAGKLVNLHTDIPLDMPIRDEVVKQIVDRRPMRIRRKGIKDIYAPVPAVHIFGGNGIPKALDGISRAHDRRWTFLGFSKFVPKGNYDRDYWDFCYEQSPQGVLNFALEGLQDLLNEGGHFLVPDSGRQKMEEWQLESDPVGTFLRDVEQGEVADGNNKLMRGSGTQIERKRLWDVFVKWHEHTYNFAPKIGKIGFFDVLRHKKLTEKTTKGVRYFEGVGLEVESTAQY